MLLKAKSEVTRSALDAKQLAAAVTDLALVSERSLQLVIQSGAELVRLKDQHKRARNHSFDGSPPKQRRVAADKVPQPQAPKPASFEGAPPPPVRSVVTMLPGAPEEGETEGREGDSQRHADGGAADVI